MKWLKNINRTLKRLGKSVSKIITQKGGNDGQQPPVIQISNGKKVKVSMCAPKIITKDDVAECAASNNSNKCMRLKMAKVEKSVHSGSCLTLSALGKLIKAYNKHHPQSQIPSTTAPDQQWEAFAAKMNPNLSEHEWLDLAFVKSELSADEIDKLKKEHFRPAAPKGWKQNPTTWLNTYDIDNVLGQYMEKYPDFKYFGAVPSDFSLKAGNGDCMISELCAVNLKDLKKQKYNYFAAVFNFDPHNKSGSHWVGLFVNMVKKEINYLDSNGYKPIPPIKQLMLTIKGQAAALGEKYKIQYCNKRHQLKNTECGVYAINFISSQIEGKEFGDIVNNVVRDDAMNERRSEFFNGLN